MFVHSIMVDGKNYERLKNLIAELKKIETIGHGFDHNNSRAYVIYATKNLSELLKSNGFTLSRAVRQI